MKKTEDDSPVAPDFNYAPSTIRLAPGLHLSGNDRKPLFSAVGCTKMSSAVQNSRLPRPVFKWLGAAAGRVWTEISPGGASAPTEAGIKPAPDQFGPELRDFINTPNLLVLAGSGTSLGRGLDGPSLEKMWRVVRKLKGFAETCMAVRHPEADENLEHLLARCKSALQFLQGAVKTIVEEFVTGAEREIAQQCSEFLREGDLGAHREFLRRVAGRRPALPRLRLFTTNYDRCFEQAAGELGFPVVDGFCYSLPRRFSARFFHCDFVRTEPGSREALALAENVFHLVKLHGSVDWNVKGDAVFQEEQPTNRGLIYPRSATLEATLAHLYLEMMGLFLAALRLPRTALLTVGFGFTDEHLTQPIRAALESSPDLRLWVVDRAAEEKSGTPGMFHDYLRRRIASRDDRVTLVNGDFDQVVEQLPNPGSSDR